MRKVEVEYLALPGWQSSTVSVTSFPSLPANAQAYIKKIEELIGIPSE